MKCLLVLLLLSGCNNGNGQDIWTGKCLPGYIPDYPGMGCVEDHGQFQPSKFKPPKKRKK